MRKHVKAGGNNEVPTPVVSDDLPPYLKVRVKALLLDLVNNDLDMALLDLGHLHRALTTGLLDPPDQDRHVQRYGDDIQALICSDDDGTAVEELCEGPDERGRCPRPELSSPVGCADKWIMAKGWNLKVPAAPVDCPLISLGLAHRDLHAAIASNERGD